MILTLMTRPEPVSVTVPTEAGEMPAQLWRPASGSGPGLLLLQEIFGVSGYIRRRAADLAEAGYVVLAPELYWRLDAGPVDDLPRRPSGRVDRAAADGMFADMRARVEERPDDWRSWFRLALAYDAAGDRTRAREAARHALALHG